ncbi:MAG: glycerol-3-phosphate acyltransferase, partial [Paracoccaceae bacterium]
AWPVGAATCLTWLVAALIGRMSSLSALVASALAAVWADFLGYPSMIWLTVLLATLVYCKHRPNIERILAGTEPKIGRKG